MGTAALILLGISLGFALGYGTGRVRSDARVFRAGHAAGWDARDGLDQFDPGRPVTHRGQGGWSLLTHLLAVSAVMLLLLWGSFTFGGVQ